MTNHTPADRLLLEALDVAYYRGRRDAIRDLHQIIRAAQSALSDLSRGIPPEVSPECPRERVEEVSSDGR